LSFGYLAQRLNRQVPCAKNAIRELAVMEFCPHATRQRARPAGSATNTIAF
jgi:hypothetical protein